MLDDAQLVTQLKNPPRTSRHLRVLALSGCLAVRLTNEIHDAQL